MAIKGIQGCICFGDGAFEPLAEWMQHCLHVDLTTCAADSHVPRAENAIRFVKERLRAIQCEIQFRKYLKRLTIEMVKWVTVFINSLRRKSGVHPVMSPRQILFGKKFKTMTVVHLTQTEIWGRILK